jgi:hypothetical protein
VFVVGVACFGAVIGWLRAAQPFPTGAGRLLVLFAVVAATVADAVLVGGVAAAGPVVFGLLAGWLAHGAFRWLIAVRTRVVGSTDGF